ncbi:VOC family protein [Pseudomaricurvus alkylphenolicus]|uniref:VOC family protein n=1 Tax=Pseudomaricurvus alkylphenolicus TaxID=1306991 RepID=UPI00141EBFE4|nr:VOC family protein [Pseudomaricurvus alkylphenolicus]NIB42520.1 VOC family protein [Pseudomaricurvus alkylphenolicus]
MKPMDLMQIDHVGIRVKDIERSLAFYQQLGFSIICDAGYLERRPVIIKHPSGIELNLLGPANSCKDVNVLMDIGEKHPGFTHVALRVQCLDDAIAALKERHFKITEGPLRFFAGMRSVFVRDPDKNVIEITENSHDYKDINREM